MARRKKGLDIHGILLLDKRAGISSNKALQEVKGLLNANKAGHTGSLDPLATGLLPLCFGEATKVSALMLDDDKRYQVEIKLGELTDTGDAEGAVVNTMPVPELDEQLIDQCLQHFTGEIEQIPPMYSALKYNGKKLYELAREGIEIERKPRKIKIFSCELLAYKQPVLTLQVHCSKGTYIRSLAEDIGTFLGSCATVKSLRRMTAGRFSIDHALSQECLSGMSNAELQSVLIPVDAPLEFMPAIRVSNEQACRITQGQQLQVNEPVIGQVRMYSDQGFLGLGEMLSDGRLAPRKLFHITRGAA